MDAFTPAQTTELVSRIGAKKARMRLDKMFINSFLGGALLSFGAALSLSTNSSPWFQTNAPGLLCTISAMVFPVGLIMVMLTGADLFTSYCMYSVVALLHRRCSFADLLKTWVVSFVGNLAGALFLMAVLTGYGGTFEADPYRAKALSFAKSKALTPYRHQIFLKSILCNWFVCMAVFLAISSREIISKIIAIWFPVMCFVGLVTDRVIANMYFMPLAIFLDAPKPLTVGYYIWKSMIPALLGNIVGGGLFCGAVYWYLFLEGEEVEMHFDEIGDGRKGSAFGVPVTEHVNSATLHMTNGNGGSHIQSHGQDSIHPTEPSNKPLPNSGNMAVTGFVKDYQVQDYGRKNSDQMSGTTT
ncbi:Formate/nitrite transporter-domain-containing protein [Rhexocercosporidium sp. MPI-PUGE-AT-0058]|nr:Formate/nitrite transporter-domain-containing protein [Rhexocercosporidium sp. MPI-PUGE-AT-0058]